VVGGEGNEVDDGFFFFFRKYTGSFNFFYIILILFNLMWNPKTQVPHHMAP
jgi:hypothetical protein